MFNSKLFILNSILNPESWGYLRRSCPPPPSEVSSLSRTQTAFLAPRLLCAYVIGEVGPLITFLRPEVGSRPGHTILAGANFPEGLLCLVMPSIPSCPPPIHPPPQTAGPRAVPDGDVAPRRHRRRHHGRQRRVARGPPPLLLRDPGGPLQRRTVLFWSIGVWFVVVCG